jgi:uncharacterized protein (TIGR02996 family)
MRQGMVVDAALRHRLDPRLHRPTLSLNGPPAPSPRSLVRYGRGRENDGGFVVALNRELLEGVRTNPEDDAVRRVCADWLDKNGEPERAAFVRAQLDRAALPPGDGRRAALHGDELRLLAEHAGEWLAGPPLLRRSRFRRGFVEYLTGSAAELVEQAAEAFALAPIREVRISKLGERPGLGAALAALPVWQHVEAVSLDDMEGDPAPREEVLAFFGGPHLRQVRRLTLMCGACDAEVFRQLLALPALQRLEALRVNGGMDADDVAGVVADFPHLPLCSLRVHKGPYGSWGLTLRGLDVLARSRRWRQLTELNVGIEPTPDMLASIAEGLPHSRIHPVPAPGRRGRLRGDVVVHPRQAGLRRRGVRGGLDVGRPARPALRVRRAAGRGHARPDAGAVPAAVEAAVDLRRHARPGGGP